MQGQFCQIINENELKVFNFSKIKYLIVKCGGQFVTITKDLMSEWVTAKVNNWKPHLESKEMDEPV